MICFKNLHWSQTMARIVERRQTWRIASLAFPYLAAFGPWAYDQINVPAEYSCNFPNVRLEGNFCGVPLSGIGILFMVIEGLGSVWGQYLAGSAVFPSRARELLFMISFILFPLPFFSTMFVLFKRNSRGLQIFQLGMLALGTALGLFWFVILSYPYPHPQIWRLWGFWSYLVTAIGMMVLESLVLRMKKDLHEDWKLKYNV